VLLTRYDDSTLGLTQCSEPLMSVLHDQPVAGNSLLKDEFLVIAQARDDRALDSGIQKFVSDTGFERYGVVVLHDDFSGRRSSTILAKFHNAPPEYLQTYEDREKCKVDPVLQHCKRSSTPFTYGQETYVNVGAAERWEHQSQFGFSCGIASAFHLPSNQHVVFGVDRRHPLPTHPIELTELVARVHLFGTFVQCAALNLLSSRTEIDLKQERQPRLSPREFECLQWAAEGKTAWETGMLLSIAEATVAKILASALRKLDCATKPQAVVKALRLGLIH
jgi:DNA-binding CsgD family transcriptional regulator